MSINPEKKQESIVPFELPHNSPPPLKQELHLKTILDNFPFMVWLKDADSRLLMANTAYAKMAGVASSEELEGKTDFDFFPEDLAQQYVDGDKEVMDGKLPVSRVGLIQDANGERYWIESYKSPLIENNQVVGTVGFARDVTRSLKNESEYFSIIQKSPNSIVRYDRTNKRIFINPRTSEIYQVPPDFLLGKSPSEFPGGQSSIAFEQSIQEVFSHGGSKTIEIHCQLANGDPKVIRFTLVAEYDQYRKVSSVISLGQDVSESFINQERINRLAYYDTLTNLPNRLRFSERLENVKVDAELNGQKFALIVLDIDRFKEINDSLGHAVGDALLCEVAKRLSLCINESDKLARIAGDEFAILLPKINHPSDVASIVSEIQQSQLESYLISGKELLITLSLGVAIYPTDSVKVEELFKFADSALYCAKRLGRGHAQFYSKELTLRAIDRLSLESSLRKALANNEFELHFQPQINIETKEIIGAEALIRWNREHKEWVPPDKFIYIAEDTGLIIEIGEWVISTACIAAVKWNENRTTPFQVAINLSSRQFIRNDIVGTIQGILEKTKCKPEWIKVEITESLLLEKEENIKHSIGLLHDMGILISLDDFGTGYSALGYLIHFPVDQLKIDKSFVNDITTNDDRGLLVKAIISMATSLRINVIAEGVETIEQANYLKESGCHYAQGYFYGKPMRFEALSEKFKF